MSNFASVAKSSPIAFDFTVHKFENQHAAVFIPIPNSDSPVCFFGLISLKIKFIELSLYNKKLRLMVFSVTLFTHSVTWHWSFVHTILWNTKYMFFTRKAYFLSCLFILLFVYYLSDSLCNLLVFEISFLYFQLLRPMGSLSLFVQFILIQL